MAKNVIADIEVNVRMFAAMMQVKTMKLRNAYLLFYERKTPIDIQSDDEKESEKEH